MTEHAPRPAHTGTVIDRCGGINVIDCDLCGFRHLDPIPSPEELREFYDKQYYQTRRPQVLEEDQREIEHRNIAFDERLNFFKRHAPGPAILDVGCGSGLFLARARDRGFTVCGIEPSGHAVEKAQAAGLTVHHVTLDEFHGRTASRFHVVHLKNVLEHVPDPGRVIDQARELLHPGGILYVEVPNDYNLFQRLGCHIAGIPRSWISIPDHINYFTFSTLRRLVCQRGLIVLRRDTTFPMYLFPCLGLNFVKDPDLGKKLHQWRIRMELFCKKNRLGPLRIGGYRLLALAGLGRTAILYCKKPRTKLDDQE